MKTETFKDSKSREWSVSVTPWEAEKIEQAFNINIYDLVDTSEEEKAATLIGKLEQDNGFLSAVLWTICQGEHPGVDKKDFTQSLTGSVLDDAYLALLKATANFFRRPEQRLAMRTLVGRLEKVKEVIFAKAEKEIDESETKFDPVKFVNELGNSLQSRESIPSQPAEKEVGATRSEN